MNQQAIFEEELAEEEERIEEQLTEEQQALVIENISFARKLSVQFARDRRSLGIEVEEFQSAALLGLCDAARRFDEVKGLQFRTFAYFRIRGAMFDLVRREGLLPRRYFQQQKQINEGEQEGCNEVLAKLPYAFARTPRELVGLAGTIHELGIRLSLNAETDSVELAYSNELTPEDIAIFHSSQRYVRKLVKKLPTVERRLIRLRYFEGCSFSEIQNRFDGKSRSWVSRLHTRAVDNLRDLVRAELNARG